MDSKNTFHVKQLSALLHMPSKKLTTREIGDTGEQIASQYLQNIGFSLIERNYWRKWGEIDLIVSKNNKIHFVEVKTVSHATIAELEVAVLRGTWRPEEQVHQFKLHQIHKALETWVSERAYEGEWQIDVIAMRIVPRETYACVNYIQNIT